MSFRKRYNLPPTDPRYLNATLEEIVTDYWAHFYADGKGGTEEVEDDDFDLEQVKRDMESGDWEEVKL